MEEMMIKDEVFAKQSPFIEKIAVDQNGVILKDNKKNRIAEVLMNKGELQCLLDDERTDCVHVGSVYSLPELYGIISSKGVRPAGRGMAISWRGAKAFQTSSQKLKD
jgi:hypothetical protein